MKKILEKITNKPIAVIIPSFILTLILSIVAMGSSFVLLLLFDVDYSSWEVDFTSEDFKTCIIAGLILLGAVSICIFNLFIAVKSLLKIEKLKLLFETLTINTKVSIPISALLFFVSGLTYLYSLFNFSIYVIFRMPIYIDYYYPILIVLFAVVLLSLGSCIATLTVNVKSLQKTRNFLVIPIEIILSVLTFFGIYYSCYALDCLDKVFFLI